MKNKDEINSLISQLMGRRVPDPEEYCCDHCWRIAFEKNVPNYCGDLNAMHEAEEFLTKNQQVDFEEILTNVIWQTQSRSDNAGFLRIHATARQRAEAFLKTMNSYEE